MVTEIKLGENCRILYGRDHSRIRSYRFEYELDNGIKNDCTYDVYFTTVDFKDMFVVKSFIDDNVYFETFKDAETYIFKEISKLKNRIYEEQEQIKNSKKKGRKKKNGK